MSDYSAITKKKNGVEQWYVIGPKGVSTKPFASKEAAEAFAEYLNENEFKKQLEEIDNLDGKEKEKEKEKMKIKKYIDDVKMEMDTTYPKIQERNPGDSHYPSPND